MATKAKRSKTDIPVNISGLYMKERKEVVSIEALSWAAERVGLSYGRYTLSLSPEQQRRIQEEYEAWKRKLAQERAEKSKGFTESLSSPFTGGILIDEDL